MRSAAAAAAVRFAALALGVALAVLLAVAGSARASSGQASFGAPSLIDNQPPFSQRASIYGISCGTPSSCVAVDGTSVEVASGAGGTSAPSWTKPDLIAGASTMRAVSCPSGSLCLALGDSTVTRSTDGGASWSTPVTLEPGGNSQLAAASCDTTGVCVVGDGLGYVFISTDGGQTWSPSEAADTSTNNTFTGMSCIGGGVCVGVDAAGYAVTSRNVAIAGTPTWTTTQIDTSMTGSASLKVSCTSNDVCLAVDSAGRAMITTTANAATPAWSVSSATGDTAQLNAVSCTVSVANSAQDDCVAVDNVGNAVISTNIGAATPTWSLQPTGDATSLSAVACLGGSSVSDWCVVGDGNGNELYSVIPLSSPTTATWSAPLSLDGTNSLSAVACVGSGVCTAVDASGHAVSSGDDGVTWSSPVTADATVGLDAVSCLDSGECVAMGSHDTLTSGQIATGLGSGAPTWSKASIDPGALLRGVACVAGGGLCVAVDSAGTAWTTSNPAAASPTWTPVATPDQTPTGPNLRSVSCPSLTLCVAVDDLGNALISTNPAATSPVWLAFPTGDPTPNLLAISCPTTTLCAAVDGRGEVVVSTNPAAASPAWSAPQATGATTGGDLSCTTLGLCVMVGDGEQVFYSVNPTAASPTWTAVSPAGSTNQFNGVSCVTAGGCVLVDGGGNAVTGSILVPAVALSATSGTFPATTVGTTSAAQTFTVTNSGQTTLNVSGAALGGGNAGEFKLTADTCSGAAVAPGASCSVGVAFAPTAAGAASTNLAITSDAGSSPDQVALSGTAVAATTTTLTTTTMTSTITTPTPPSNVFRFVKVKAGTKGEITIELKIPDRGRLSLTTSYTSPMPKSKTKRGKKPKAIAYAGATSSSPKGATVITIKIKPDKAAARALQQHKTFRVVMTATFTPSGGTRRTETTTVTVKSK